jgi:L-rhamnonate dehydratase
MSAPMPPAIGHTATIRDDPVDRSATTIHDIQLWRLAPQQSGLPAGLPESIAAPALTPVGPDRAEHRERFALCLVADGALGWHGPLSQPVALVVTDDHAPGLIGHDAAEPRRLAYRPTTGRHRSGAHARAAFSAVDLACWDLASQASGRPVSDLLGGTVRRRIRAYASALGLDPAHPAASEAASWIVHAGFWAQKWPLTKELIGAGPRRVAEVLGRLRHAAGDARFAIDGLGRCRLDEALLLLPVLADLDVAFAEELLLPGSWAWHRMRAHGPVVPLAAGEHAVDPGEQTRLLTGGAVDVWQVDPGWGGGLARSLHTVEVAADLGIPVLPHGAHLPAALALAATCCRDKVPAVEYHLTVEPLRQQIHTAPLVIEQGHLTTRTEAGMAEPLVTVGGAPVWSVDR